MGFLERLTPEERAEYAWVDIGTGSWANMTDRELFGDLDSQPVPHPGGAQGRPANWPKAVFDQLFEKTRLAQAAELGYPPDPQDVRASMAMDRDKPLSPRHFRRLVGKPWKDLVWPNVKLLSIDKQRHVRR